MMSDEHNHKRKVYRMPPCNSYDVDGMEEWLSDMAEEGLFLAQDGFFIGIAVFEKDEPRKLEYHLKVTGKSNDTEERNGETEENPLSDTESSWKYVASRGGFDVYRSEEGAIKAFSRIEQEAGALKAAVKKQKSKALSLLFALTVYPLIFLRGAVFLTAIHIGTWLTILTAIFALGLIFDSFIAWVSLNKLRDRLNGQGEMPPSGNWRKKALPYRVKVISRIALGILIAFSFINLWSADVLHKDEMPLDADRMPFATLRDLAGEEGGDYKELMSGMSKGFNTFKEWSDFLAPRCVNYNEHAQITLSSGLILEGGLYVDYYESVNPKIADNLFKEIQRIDKREKGFEVIQNTKLPADSSAAYYTSLHFPVVLLKKENVVIKVCFYQTSSNYTMPLDEWGKVIWDGLGEK